MEKYTNRLIPANEWPKHHAWPPIGGLRHLIFYARSNGFDQVVRRVGRRVLIDEQAFFTWVERQGSVSESVYGPARQCRAATQAGATR